MSPSVMANFQMGNDMVIYYICLLVRRKWSGGHMAGRNAGQPLQHPLRRARLKGSPPRLLLPICGKAPSVDICPAVCMALF